MRNQKGFTLVEVVTASMLIGMVLLAAFPLIMTGRSVVKQGQVHTEAKLIGDSVFERISGELGDANRVYFGTMGELKASEGKEMHGWKRVDVDVPGNDFVIRVEAEEEEQGWIFLSVEVVKGDEVVYERKEAISLLNLMLFQNREIEGEYISVTVELGEESIANRPEIWYQNAK